jgi:hypothetical protein
MSNSEQSQVRKKQYCASHAKSGSLLIVNNIVNNIVNDYEMRDTPMTRLHQLSTATASLLSGAILTAVLAFGAPVLHAEDIDRCQRRVAHADHELHEAIEKHGRNSRQANHERRELHEARERCWAERHRWWDEHEHRWHTERDWDEHDHD